MNETLDTRRERLEALTLQDFKQWVQGLSDDISFNIVNPYCCVLATFAKDSGIDNISCNSYSFSIRNEERTILYFVMFQNDIAVINKKLWSYSSSILDKQHLLGIIHSLEPLSEEDTALLKDEQDNQNTESEVDQDAK